MEKALYIFIDESGNFDFSDKGTKFFALTAVSTTSPSVGRENLIKLKYRLLLEPGGVGDYFHATEDKQDVRDEVFGLIGQTEGIIVDSITVEKKAISAKVIGQEGKEETVYGALSKKLLDHIFKRHENVTDVSKIVVILGSLFTKKKQEAVLKILKSYLKKFHKPFFTYFHRVHCDLNCQIADYCGWAIYVSLERGEGRPLEVIGGKIDTILDASDVDLEDGDSLK